VSEYPTSLRAEWRNLNGARLHWRVDDIAAKIAAGWESVQVFSASGEAGPYSTLGSPVALVADQREYTYDHAAGTEATWYTVAYYEAGGPTTGDQADPVEGSGGGRYVTVAEMRDEGVTTTQADNNRVRKIIKLAESFIEKTTGRWFYPKNLELKFDGKYSDYLEVGPPIIAITDIKMLYEPVVGGYTYETLDVDSVRVYNRHLTQGLVDPDDRDAPKLVVEDYDWQTVARWWKGHQNVVLTGTYGYTVLGDETAGETSEGSQVPLYFGHTPQEIRDVAQQLVVRYLPQRGDLDAVDDSTRRSDVTKIKTRDQEINYTAGGQASGGSHILAGSFTGDPKIDSILALYKRPAHIVAV
jgi:hypothetical protein